jgi:hypothetical protein
MPSRLPLERILCRYADILGRTQCPSLQTRPHSPRICAYLPRTNAHCFEPYLAEFEQLQRAKKVLANLKRPEYCSRMRRTVLRSYFFADLTQRTFCRKTRTKYHSSCLRNGSPVSSMNVSRIILDHYCKRSNESACRKSTLKGTNRGVHYTSYPFRPATWLYLQLLPGTLVNDQGTKFLQGSPLRRFPATNITVGSREEKEGLARASVFLAFLDMCALKLWGRRQP